jgi:Fic family protein
LRQLKPNVVLEAIDSDVIKTYVKLGMGVGVVAEMAMQGEERNPDLVARPAGHLFGQNVARVAFKRGAYLRQFVLRFAELLSDRLSRDLILKAIRTVEDSATLYSPQAIQELHHELFSRLPETDLNPAEGQAIVPGNWREREVQVGRHVAPTHTSLSAFMDRWSSFYGSIRRSDAALVAVAAAHQRLGWIHPFIDGNGRVMRLHTHLWLHAMGYTGGLWSPLRGFARNAERYYALLAAADEHRHGDLDGRGNLSEKALVAWIQYVLETCRDQVDFMQQLLDLTTMKSRLEACLIFESVVRKSGIRPEALRAMHYLYLSGENLSRGEFKGMLGLGDRSATDVLSALLRRGLLKSDTPQGKVRFGLPQHALRFLFPRLWPEAETDAEEMQSSD